MLKNFPRSSEKQLLKISELTKEYLELALDDDKVLKSEYEIITQLRSAEETVADYLFVLNAKLEKV